MSSKDVLPSDDYEAKLARRDLLSTEDRLLRRAQYINEAERRRVAREVRDELFRGGLGFVVGGSSSGAMVASEVNPADETSRASHGISDPDGGVGVCKGGGRGGGDDGGRKGGEEEKRQMPGSGPDDGKPGGNG